MSKHGWYRGYIVSRPVRGTEVPQKVQNLVIRSYCDNRSLVLHLSATEVAIPGSAMMLNSILSELDEMGGIVMYSMYALPDKAHDRRRVYDIILNAGCSLHAALEGHMLSSLSDIEQWEEMIRISQWLVHTPFHGEFDKAAPKPMMDRLIRGDC
jgi:sporadic carbohydrate cluster protein (TIGR04323 family)